MDLTREELKKLLATIITCSGDYSYSENINRSFIYEIADRNGLIFSDAEPDNIWNTEQICIDKAESKPENRKTERELMLEELGEMIDYLYEQAENNDGCTAADAFQEAAQRLVNFKNSNKEVLENV